MKLPLRYEDECHYDKAGTVVAKFWCLYDADDKFLGNFTEEEYAQELVDRLNQLEILGSTAVEQDLASQG